MTWWELQACVQGYNEAHGTAQRPPPMSDRRFDQLKARAAALSARSENDG